MKFRIDSSIINMFPELCICVIAADNVENKIYPHSLDELIEVRRNELREMFKEVHYREDERIASWRDAYRKMGINPKEYPPTSESLVKRALSEKPLPRISAAVDIYLASLLKFMLPIGGYDCETLRGDIVLCKADGGEDFEPLARGPVEKVDAGEVVYRDNKRILTRRWNYRDADPTKITYKTTRLILCIESVKETFGKEYIEENAADIVKLLKKYCYASVSTTVFKPKDNPVVDIPLP